jgi:predicted amidohydrolase YtcJ
VHVVFNARVYTVDSRLPKAEAFAVEDNHFVAVGSSGEIGQFAGKRTRTLNARQTTIVLASSIEMLHTSANV